MGNNAVNENQMLCPICGEKHSENHLCPIVNEKIKKSIEAKKDSYPNIMGNIFYECLQQKVDFRQVIREITYIISMYHESHRLGSYGENSMDLILDYFANELKLKSPESKFFKPRRELENTLLDYLDERIGQPISNVRVKIGAEGKVIGIGTTHNIDFLFDPNVLIDHSIKPIQKSEKIKGRLKKTKKHVQAPKRIKVRLEKTKFGENWIYTIQLDCQADVHVFTDGQIKNYCLYTNELIGPTRYITILQGNGPKYEHFFENHIRWIDWAQKGTYNSELEEDYIDLLYEYTRIGILDWEFFDSSYTTGYMDKKFIIGTKTINGKEVTRLYIRHDKNTAIYFDYDEDSSNRKTQASRARNLIPLIEEAYKDRDELLSYVSEGEITVPVGSVIVIARAFICRRERHSMKVYKGLIPIETYGGEGTNFAVYLGYCEKCNHYYMFNRDLKEAMKIGDLLCNIIQEDYVLYATTRDFHGLAESFLTEMGYNVKRGNGMSTEDRHKLLEEILATGCIPVSELINHLEWNIHMHENQKNYSLAVNKWATDIHFLKHEATKGKETVEIKTLKTNLPISKG